MTNLNAEERIKRVQIKLWEDKPFWAYLSYFLKFHETPPEQMKMPTMDVDLDGNIRYSKKFVDGLTDDKELKGVIAHELAHLLFITHLRLGGRDEDGWNISTDLSNNCLLIRDGFTLPKGCLIPNNNDEILCGFGKKIERVSEKLAEEIYDELPKVTIDKDGNIFVEGHGNNKGKKEKIGKMIDGHIVGRGNKGQGKEGKDKKEGNAFDGLSESEKKELENKWKERMVEAHTIAKMKGNVPEGIERFIERLFESKIDWRTLLQRYIINQIPYDYGWQTPHKKSVSISTYLPDEIKEKIEIAVMIDLSGSIGQDEYGEFISELIGICRAFQETIDMRIFSHDTECYDCGYVTNGNIEKIKDLKLRGGGGTSFQIPLKYLDDNNIKPKCLIWLTDGYGDKPDKPDFDILWVLSKNGSDELLKESGEIIKLEED